MTILNEWKIACVLLIKIQKNCENYRGSSLLNLTYKIYSNVLIQTLAAPTENIVLEGGDAAGITSTTRQFLKIH